MKGVIILCVVLLVELANCDTKTHSRGCIYSGKGQCVRECEEGTHAYATGCGFKTPEATCDEPTPQQDKKSGIICDYSSCYCDPPTVRDTVSKKCVQLADCPKKE